MTSKRNRKRRIENKLVSLLVRTRNGREVHTVVVNRNGRKTPCKVWGERRKIGRRTVHGEDLHPLRKPSYTMYRGTPGSLRCAQGFFEVIGPLNQLPKVMYALDNGVWVIVPYVRLGQRGEGGGPIFLR